MTAVGHDSRIDLRWPFDTDPNLEGYNVYRADAAQGPFTRINASVHKASVYSDFFGVNDRTYYYCVRSVAIRGGGESEPSQIVSATSAAMTDEQLLTSVQEAVFRYFWDYGHPVSGLAREGYGFSHSPDTCTSGGTGMGLMALCVGAERHFVTRAEAAGRVLRILTFLDEKAARFHGAWSHWIHGGTGATKPFSQYDDGGDLVETAYVVQGLLTVRQYFGNAGDPVETEIRRRATRMWEQVEWSWYRQSPRSEALYWHWSPNYEWKINMPIRGYNECMIVYLLAIASPTYPIPASCYEHGWTKSADYANGSTYYGYPQWVGPEKGGPLFFTQYSFLGFDPRDKRDSYCNYFENSRNISLIHRAYCRDNPRGYAGYSDLVWGLTASFNPWGYNAHSPTNDNGTIAPTAALERHALRPQRVPRDPQAPLPHLRPRPVGTLRLRGCLQPHPEMVRPRLRGHRPGPDCGHAGEPSHATGLASIHGQPGNPAHAESHWLDQPLNISNTMTVWCWTAALLSFPRRRESRHTAAFLDPCLHSAAFGPQPKSP